MKAVTKDDFLKSVTAETVITLQHDQYGERIQSFRTAHMEFLPGSMLDAVKDQLSNLWDIYTDKK